MLFKLSSVLLFLAASIFAAPVPSGFSESEADVVLENRAQGGAAPHSGKASLLLDMCFIPSTDFCSPVRSRTTTQALEVVASRTTMTVLLLLCRRPLCRNPTAIRYETLSCRYLALLLIVFVPAPPQYVQITNSKGKSTYGQVRDTW